MALLTQLDALHLGTVVEDTIDQLAVLGKIMPSTLENRADAKEIVGDEIGDILESQRNLETRYEQLILKRAELREGGKKDQLRAQENNQEIGDVIGGLRLKTNHFSKALKQSPLTSDNLAKTQKDRQYVQDILTATLQEMQEERCFTSLVDAVTLEQDNKTELQNTILKEEEGRKRIKMLQRQITNIKSEREDEIQQRDEMIAHLKDQLQEMKAKTNMEGKYVQKDAEVTVQQTQKRCFLSDKQMKEEIEQYKKMIDEEVRVNQEIEQYLKTHQLELDQRVEYWMEKYDKDVEAKTHELDVLKASKANDLARLQELTKLYSDYEKVVVEDRVEKEKKRRKEQQEEEELKSIIAVQSWWRGVMVRRQLGPYSKKKKKGKKGKKGSGGKKKGKKKK
ncbi:dynein regulatory complex protein 9-like [Anneissia japonica]|uniref:dynein regulatory complex protein 9-like n=1 Tax=Anneissia japonica TaxID=1529436 RepID=UPI001425BB75|nr:dynein regulatory complex protein 9-like [Anneissia japonica]XP_033117875.1 dynein regulatory complex protein 9-like [Anneissia japonica]